MIPCAVSGVWVRVVSLDRLKFPRGCLSTVHFVRDQSRLFISIIATILLIVNTQFLSCQVLEKSFKSQLLRNYLMIKFIYDLNDSSKV